MNTDITRLILGYLDDEDLARACMLNKDFATRICNSTFWLNKIITKYNIPKYIIDKYLGSNNYMGYYYNITKVINMRDLFDYGLRNGRLDYIILSMSKGYIVNGHDLINAAGYGNLDIIKYLIYINNIKTEDMKEALSYAAYHNRTDVVKYLISVGINLDTSDALLYASDNNNLEMIKAILNTNKTNLDEALIVASAAGNYQTIELLMDYGVNVSVNNNEALIRACDNCLDNSSSRLKISRLKTIKLLLDNGADVSARNNEALILATVNDCKDIVKLLLDYGADPTILPDLDRYLYN